MFLLSPVFFYPPLYVFFLLVFFSKYIGTGIGVYPFFEDFFIHGYFFYTRPFSFWMWGGYPPCSPKDVPILSPSQTHEWIPNLPEGRTCGREGAPGDLLDLQVVRAAALATGDASAITEVRPPPSFKSRSDGSRNFKFLGILNVTYSPREFIKRGE